MVTVSRFTEDSGSNGATFVAKRIFINGCFGQYRIVVIKIELEEHVMHVWYSATWQLECDTRQGDVPDIDESCANCYPSIARHQ